MHKVFHLYYIKKEWFFLRNYTYAYPVLRKTTFLTEKEKENVDHFLRLHDTKMKKYLVAIHKILPLKTTITKEEKEKREKLLTFLITQKIVEKKYQIRCPVCGMGKLSDVLTEKEKNDFSLEDTEDCMYCDASLEDFTFNADSLWDNVYQLIMDKNKK